ncbi:methionine ABC transporter permease [Streptomyces sp. TP-A0874]|uniref:methionine ABC transporter permease n=1 Tax=Streptomyces sp. TP-A0874 TaxID=549819 RepID=UPI000B0FF648|nr:methionine ABC transporter permease [Streptomyces sp. TP-A0874]
MTWSQMQPLLAEGCWDTLFMVGWSSLIAVLGGLPLGVLLVLTDRGELLQNAPVNKIVGVVVNIGRSFPFIVLMVALIPFTRWVVGTSIGAEATVVPLAVGAIPFYARLVETAVREVDGGLVEAAQSMGAGTWTIVRKVLLPQSLPSLVAGFTTTVIALIGYSAMAGAIGGGGLGSLALTYGYQRFETDFMLVTVALLIVLVTAVQVLGDLAARAIARRGRATSATPRTPLRRLRTRGTRGAAQTEAADLPAAAPKTFSPTSPDPSPGGTTQ